MIMFYCYNHSVALHSQSRNLLLLLLLSIDHNSLQFAQQCHSRILTLGFSQNLFLATKLISAYAVCGIPTDSQLVFNSLEQKTVHLWNSLINGYVKNHMFDKSYYLFHQMFCCGVLPDNYTFSTLSKVCGEMGDLSAGKLIHGMSIRTGFVLDTIVANSLMSMYCKCREFKTCFKLFDEIPERNTGSWNVVVAGYVDSRDCILNNEIIGFVKDMQIEGFKPDAFTVSSLLLLCNCDTGKWDYGRELHGFIVRIELGWFWSSGSDIHSGCCLIDMYSRIKKVDAAKRVFDQMKRRNVYVWTAMINGYVQTGALEEDLVLFREMQACGVEPSRVSLVSVLPTCGSLAGLSGGKQIHGYAIRKQMNYDVSLNNALIDMCSKCGNLNYARRVFEDGSFYRDAISWSSMVSGYGLHGKGEEAISIYERMIQMGNKPDI